MAWRARSLALGLQREAAGAGKGVGSCHAEGALHSVAGPHGQRRGGAVAAVSPEETFPTVGFHGQWRGGAAAKSPKGLQEMPQVEPKTC
jgi:hypothetical protein